MRRAVRCVLPLLALTLPTANGVYAQRAQAAIVPDSITVGDVFHAAIRIDLPPGARIIAPDTLVLGEHLETAGRREVRMDSAGGMRRATLLYPLTAWRPDVYELPDVTLQLAGDGGVATVLASLPSFTVLSVLPLDTAGIEPRPAKDVFGANRVWWPILLGLLIAALIATALYVWWRRRRRPEPVVFAPSVPAHERALAQLATLSREGLVERGDFRRYYERLTFIMRQYAGAVQPDWSTDLTTSELAARLRRDMNAIDAVELVRILGAGDLIKFARATTTRDSAARDLDAARAWIERTIPAPPPESDAQRAA
jgi:hypothetical protein